MKIKSLDEIDLVKKTVLVRTCFDEPFLNGRIDDDFRIRSALPTLNFLVKKQSKIIVISHLGRPKVWDEKFSLEPVAYKLAEIWNRKLVIIPKGNTLIGL